MDYSVNAVVSKNMQVKALEEDQSATYKLCDADLVDLSRIDEATNKPKNCSPRRSMLGKTTIVDINTKKRITIMNVVGIEHAEQPDHSLREIPKIARIVFPRTGVLTLGPENQGTYMFLERHPFNRDNPFRNKNDRPKFYRINAKKRAIEEMQNDYIMADAMVHVRDANESELKAILMAMDSTAKKEINPESFETLKRDLFRYVKKHPVDVMKASSNKLAKMKIQIMDAEHFNLIAFLENEEDDKMPRRWINVSTDTDICTLDITQNKIDGLLDYIQESGEDGVDVYQKVILNGLKKILKPA